MCKLTSSIATCKDLLLQQPTAASGVYSPSSGGVAMYCDMTTAGGGWTLALKMDGSSAATNYDAAFWTDSTSTTGSPDISTSSFYKSPLFNTQAFSAVMVSLRSTSGSTTSLSTNTTGTSLKTTFSGAYIATTLGRAAWKTLMPSGSLQTNCNLEGFNAIGGSAKVLLGILGNNENECNSPDSYIGIGFVGSSCGSTYTAGNTACGAADAGDKNNAAVGMIWIR